MASRRITISVPAEVATRLKKASGSRPLSTWVTALIEERLDEQELQEKWEAFYAGVAPSAADVRRAEALLERAARKRRRVA